MTVTYTYDVSNSNLKSFIKLIFRWRGSIWKSIAIELIVWCIAYTVISLVYRLALNEDQRLDFEKVCLFFERYGSLLPVTYLLGYFVQHVVTRWTEMIFRALGLIDNIALLISSYMSSNTKKAELIKRTIIRYLMVIQAMGFRIISPAMKRRFSTFDSLVDSGLLQKSEAEKLENVKFYIPCFWACSLLAKARAENFITSDCGVQQIVEYIMYFRKNSLVGVLYNHFALPICYLQVVYLCVRMFLILSLIGRQIITTESHSNHEPIDSYVPVMTIIQFIFLTGWCKVAESLLNPWGEDDDNFETNFIFDRNLRVGKTIVAGVTPEFPPLVKDSFWGEDDAEPLYSLETATETQNPCVGSAANFNVHAQKTLNWIPPIHIIKGFSHGILHGQRSHSKDFQNPATEATRRGRLYSLPGVICTERPITQTPKSIQASCPSLMDLNVELLDTGMHNAKDSADQNKHVRWRNSTDEGNKAGAKTIDDVKMALRKCSLNFNESTSDDDTKSLEAEDKTNSKPKQ
uniref:Bestrophin homolog n=1 Tax=Syphacia muris TaxID=451379 RepID=A0A0N5AFJ2_9BILA